ncbi:MAG: glycosyltransferase family 2 protein [Lachnospiraceae bacterium]|nr:glycosyltransferase family 2 protein [Lachnospiraceae bacterium]
MKLRVSVVIPNYNGEKYLKDCLDSLMAQNVHSFEIIVVDDASTDGALAQARKLYPENGEAPRIRYVTHSENIGFAGTVNEGIALARAPYVILLNNDTRVEADFVETLWKEIRRRDDVFSVSASMRNMQEPGLMDDAGDLFCALGWAFSDARDRKASLYDKRREVFSACGGAAIYRKDLLEKLGGFDEKHFAYLEDVDLGYRAKWAGYRNLYAPDAVVLHAGSASSGSRYNPFKLRLTVRNQLYLLYKNMPLWQWIVNFPLLLAGWLVKFAYFALKGMGMGYIKAFAEGISLCAQGKDRRVDFSAIPFRRQLAMELGLLINTLRRFS